MTDPERVLQLCTLEPAIHSAAFSPDGRRVVTALDQRDLIIWNAATGEEVRRETGRERASEREREREREKDRDRDRVSEWLSERGGEREHSAIWQ